ncbi:tail fiber assembly protein [Kosakonia quasisacchari]|uniref:Tail fiber assembly protein n=1 Tax=Kosakonia quasisacchari TaxID=2529380 RepID=A0A4R0GKF1_9ENTR|nr:tail fiber assembly protein [Kosakonia quasisacchari]TCB97756.1 tail fiber assembly protein [Kosakonia quasisacchari]
MPKYIYSPLRNLFYDADLESGYSVSGAWPPDAIEVPENVFLTYTGLPPEGKRRIADNEGMPVWDDVPPPTLEQFVAAAELNRQKLVDTAMQSISVIQLKLQAGRTLTETETTKLNTVLDYIDAVNALDVSTAPDINWPVLPGAQVS